METFNSFLKRVWAYSCKPGDYVFLATKKNGEFKNHAIQYDPKTVDAKLGEWLSRHPARTHDIYFCPTPFRRPVRRKQHVRESRFLWADIDDGRTTIKPTVLWESSPGRLQALWFLKDTLKPEEVEPLNRNLSYFLGADKGGWDLTQVLRVPGTLNHKYDTHPAVRLLDFDQKLVYESRKIARRVGTKKSELLDPKPSGLTSQQVLSKHRRNLPAKVKLLLSQKHVEPGNRSDIIWYLENKMSEAGLSPDEIIAVIRDSAWNKYKGRRDEEERLRTELSKIIEGKMGATDSADSEEAAERELSSGLTVESYREVMAAGDAYPGWLVEGWWLAESHGAIAGEPKSFKSTLALDLAVSVASGRPFLDKFPVHRPGPVLYIQNENARWIMKDRMAKIANGKGLIGEVRKKQTTFEVKFAEDMPLYLVNQQSYLLTDPLHRQQTEELIAKIKPALIIMDPLYLMFDGEINSAKELSPVLSWLIEIRFKYRCGVILIHHYNKGGNSDGGPPKRGGQRMMGSTTLHGWIESAWYVTVSHATNEDDLDPNTDINLPNAEALITVEREFRGTGLHPRIDVQLEMGQMGSFDYKTKVELHRPRGKNISIKQAEKDIMAVLEPSKRGLSLVELMKATGIGEEKLSKTLDRLATAKKIVRRDGFVLLASKQ